MSPVTVAASVRFGPLEAVLEAEGFVLEGLTLDGLALDEVEAAEDVVGRTVADVEVGAGVAPVSSLPPISWVAA
ncbi:MAG TPA: hypothetical protein PLA44_04185, partial [Propionibacteriaceae bacterium]|nr:hypothetical protein [Propionibacteriaceae bacterium]